MITPFTDSWELDEFPSDMWPNFSFTSFHESVFTNRAVAYRFPAVLHPSIPILTEDISIQVPPRITRRAA